MVGKEVVKMFYEKEIYVTAELCDQTVRLGNYQFFYLLQNAMIEGFDAIDCGNRGLGIKSNSYWAVTKSKIEIFRKPDWNQKLRVRAESFDDGKLRVNVITDIYSENNELLAKGIQELCILDLNTHRVKRLKETCFEMNKTTVLEKFEKFPELCDTVNSFEHTVRSQNIDMSRHMNNIEYIRLSMDLLSVEELCRMEPQYMEVHYLGECREGEKLLCQRSDTENESYITILKDGKKAFEMKIQFKGI